MGEFIDEKLPGKVPGMPCVAAPRFKTSIQITAGGNERRNREWRHPLHRFVLPEAIARDWDVVNALSNHWLITAGPWRSFPWRNPFDFASCELVKPNQAPTVSDTDQVIGTADGIADSFQLSKTYSVGGETYERPIHLPIVDTVVLAIDGVPVNEADYTVSRPGGVVTFDVPPETTVIAGPGLITGGYLFDTEVRFESDDAFEGILRATRVAGFADLTLVEVRPC